MSRSNASLSRLDHSGRSGTCDTAALGASSAASAKSESKSNPTLPWASSRLTLTAPSTAPSWISTRARRVSPNSSKAPALMSDSTVRLFADEIGILRRKSWNDSKAPFSVRALTMSSTTLNPTLRMAPMPNRMSSPTAAKKPIDSLTSGGITLMPIRRHSFRYRASLSRASPTEVSRAAMYSAG